MKSTRITDLTARCTVWLVGQTDGLVNRTDKSLIWLGAIGAHELLLPGDKLPSLTVLVIGLGILAAADAAAYFGLTPTWCTPERMCDECTELYYSKAVVGHYIEGEHTFGQDDRDIAHNGLPGGDR